MTYYIIARPYPGGLCYLIVEGIFPFINVTFVPDINLATQFETVEQARSIASGIQFAIIEEIFVDDEDDES